MWRFDSVCLSCAWQAGNIIPFIEESIYQVCERSLHLLRRPLLAPLAACACLLACVFLRPQSNTVNDTVMRIPTCFKEYPALVDSYKGAPVVLSLATTQGSQGFHRQRSQTTLTDQETFMCCSYLAARAGADTGVQ